MHVWQPFADLAERTGPTPAGLQVTVWDGTGELPDDAGQVEAMVAPYLSGDRVEQVLAALPRLRYLQTLTAGTDSLRGKVPDGVRVANARGLHDTATSELAVTLALAGRNQLRAYDDQRADGIWHVVGQRPGLADARVLLVGYGSIGKAVLARLGPFECEVTVVARTARTEDGRQVHGFEELADLAAAADVLVLVVPLTDDTRGMVDVDVLSRLPDGALVVNVGRGAVVDTPALVAELRSGRLSAALDVVDPEPLPPGHPLWSVPGLLLTPHVGGHARAFEPRARRFVAGVLARLAAGDPPLNLVDGL